MLAAHTTETPESLLRLRPDAPPALAALVMRCLEKRPDDRPQRAQDLVQALEAILTPNAGGPSAPPRYLSRWNRRALVLGFVAIMAVGVGGWLAVYLVRRSDVKPTGPLSLAVLPIENVGGDSAHEYLADGMTVELAGALRQTPGLQVAGDLSTFRFKGTHDRPEDIARQLAVGLLLTGKLRSQSGRIRLQMQLIDGTGKLLWSKTFDRDTKDNFALQDEITAAVASEMSLVLSPEVAATKQAGRTQNPQGHDLFMRGQFEKNRMSEQDLSRGLQYFQKAVALDPNYAQAHVGMAVVYDLLADVYAPSHETHALSKIAGERTLQADNRLAEAHVLYGFEMAATDWDFTAGRAEMERGLAMNPNSPDGLFHCSSASPATRHGLWTWPTV